MGFFYSVVSEKMHMAAPENIETFNRICIALFDKLYSEFPVPVEIDVNGIAMSAVPQDASYETAWDVLSVGGEVINFLAEEGFLTHKGAFLDGSQFLQVRLTMKGLAVLGYVPTSIEKQEPLISKIQGVVGGGLKEAGGEAIRQLVSQAFSLALAAAPAVGALMGNHNGRLQVGLCRHSTYWPIRSAVLRQAALRKPILLNGS